MLFFRSTCLKELAFSIIVLSKEIKIKKFEFNDFEIRTHVAQGLRPKRPWVAVKMTLYNVFYLQFC